MIRRSLVLPILVAGIALAAAAPAQARVAYGVTGGSTLISFNTNIPGTITSTTAITGLQAAETIEGVDVQPSTGELFALGSTSRLYTINLQSGAATLVGSGPFSPGLTGTAFGFDFNPVTGLIRVISNADQNFELNPSTAQTITHPNLTPGAADPSGAAYNNNFAGAPTTTLYDLGSPADSLYTQALSPDTGVLTTVGATGVAFGPVIGFDIGVDNTAFATLAPAAGSNLYTVNTGTGTATLVGAIGAAPTLVDAFTLARPLQTNPFSVAFANEPVGQTSAPTPITVTNTSDAQINIAPSLSGTGATQYAIVSNTCGAAIASGGACTIGVAFKPTQPGASAATLSVGGAGQGNNATIPLSGTGIGATVSLNPTSLAFGTQAVGSSTAPQTVTVTNTGNSALTVHSVSLNGDVRDFALRSQTCTAAPIAPGATCHAQVAFDPIAAGAKTAHLHLVDNARNGSQEVPLTGTGAAVHYALSATRLSFPNTLTNATSPTQTLTVRNTGQAPLTVSNLAFSGASTRAFEITAQTCGTPVPVGGSCTVTLAFEPLSTGAQSATLHVGTNAQGPQGAVTLAGTGVSRQAGAAFASGRAFGRQRVRTTGVKVITVRSTGTAPLQIRRLRITGRNASQFRIRVQSCTVGAIAKGRRCSIRVAFRPTSPGRKAAAITITDNVPGRAARIALRGRGTR